MATYNAADLIVSQLDTIRLQELPADYVIFRDDHSSDQTVQFLKNYIEKYELKGWQIFENDKNIGWRLNFRLLLIDGLKTDASFFLFFRSR
ncbi:glycosyltransferase [Lactococcus fujiensis]|uniref:glycosyltransferase n=1 Tax=Lactococcus fujiensis TaxID=610251 RepID=UPI000AF1CCEE|nr:glycosyltransferase [Lactococcus fujiensis]